MFIRERASMLAAGKPVTGQYESGKFNVILVLSMLWMFVCWQNEIVLVLALDDDAVHLATSSTSTNSVFHIKDTVKTIFSILFIEKSFYVHYTVVWRRQQ